MKKRYLNNITKRVIVAYFLKIYNNSPDFVSPYLRFPQLRKLFLEEKDVHKSWYHFFDFQYKTLGYIYIEPVWQVHKILNKNILFLPKTAFISEEWDYLVNKYEYKKKI
jgi:hypothetical protein